MKANEGDFSLEAVLKEVAKVDFWRAEYTKRNFYMKHKNDYNYTLKLHEKLQSQWELFVKDVDVPSDVCPVRDILYAGTRDIGFWNKKVVHKDNELYINFLLKLNLFDDVQFLHDISSYFGYYYVDLLKVKDMSELLRSNGMVIPEPPERYWHKDCHYQLFPSQSILTFMAQDPNTPTEINYIGDDWCMAHREFENTPHTVLMPPGANLLNLDFAISGRSTHDNFDLERALDEIRDFLTWNVYVLKKKFNIPLKTDEQKAIIALYRKTIEGSYGPTHASARAIGLWLWDVIKETGGTVAKAIRQLKESKLAREHALSDDRTLRRLHEATVTCIEERKVFSIKKTACKP